MSDETDQPASKIIDAFGGIRPMAARLGIPVSTVQGWKQRDTIPARRMVAVREAASAAGIELTADGAGDDEQPVATIQAPGLENEPAAGPVRAASAAASEPKKNVDPVKPQPGRGGGVAMLALVVAIGVGGWVWWSTAGPGASGGDNARFSALEGRVARLSEANDAGDGGAPGADPAALAALSRDVATLRTKLAEMTPPDLEADLGPLRGEIDDLRTALAARADSNGEVMPDPALMARLEAIEVEIQNAIQIASTNMQAMSGALVEFDTRIEALAENQSKFRAALEARLGVLEKGRTADGTQASRASALALGAGQLRAALVRGAPYPGAMDILETESAGDPQLNAAVQVLRAMSATGVATGADLELTFAQLVPELLIADRTGGDGATGDLVDRLTGRINDVISVRRTGANVPGDDVEARIARAEIYLADRDVGAAMSALDGLAGPASDVLAPWLVRAQAHVDARDALAVIEALAIARLRTDGGS